MQRPALDDPVLVVGLEGWVDAGYGAAGAVRGLLDVLETTPVASFDTDVLLDHCSRRPVMHLVEGVNTGLTWSTIDLLAATDLDGRDVLLLVGAEPDFRWRAFCDDVVGLAAEVGTRMVVGLGAFPAPVPHTRPSRLAATATSGELVEAGGYVRATLDVPAGVGGAIERRCAEAGIPALGLWAQVPHYAAGLAYPAASALLVDGLASAAGLRLDAGDLAEAAVASRERLDALIANSEEHLRLVRQLEQAWDSEETLPSGEELAAELERYLRRGDDTEPGEAGGPGGN